MRRAQQCTVHKLWLLDYGYRIRKIKQFISQQLFERDESAHLKWRMRDEWPRAIVFKANLFFYHLKIFVRIIIFTNEIWLNIDGLNLLGSQRPRLGFDKVLAYGAFSGSVGESLTISFFAFQDFTKKYFLRLGLGIITNDFLSVIHHWPTSNWLLLLRLETTWLQSTIWVTWTQSFRICLEMHFQTILTIRITSMYFNLFLWQNKWLKY